MTTRLGAHTHGYWNDWTLGARALNRNSVGMWRTSLKDAFSQKLYFHSFYNRVLQLLCHLAMLHKAAELQWARDRQRGRLKHYIDLPSIHS